MIRVPFWMMKINAALMGLIPGCAFITADQVEGLKSDNVVRPEAYTLAHLGIVPTGMGLVLPGYLEVYRDGGRFAEKKAASQKH